MTLSSLPLAISTPAPSGGTILTAVTSRQQRQWVSFTRNASVQLSSRCRSKRLETRLRTEHGKCGRKARDPVKCNARRVDKRTRPIARVAPGSRIDDTGTCPIHASTTHASALFNAATRNAHAAHSHHFPSRLLLELHTTYASSASVWQGDRNSLEEGRTNRNEAATNRSTWGRNNLLVFH